MTDVPVVRGYRTRLADRGQGVPATVLVHGTPFDLGAWDRLVPVLGGRRAIRYDVRGHGAARGVPVPGPAELAADLVGVLDLLGLSDAHLIGHSWGGQIVLQAALDHPDRVRRMSLVCTRARPFPSFHAVAEDLRAGTADRTASLARWFTPEEIAGSDPLVGDVRRTLVAADGEAWASALDMIGDFDVLDRLPGLAMPVDVVAAEYDGVGAPDHMARIAEALPCGVFHLVPGTRHLLPLQRPDLLAPLLA